VKNKELLNCRFCLSIRFELLTSFFKLAFDKKGLVYQVKIFKGQKQTTQKEL
jgi:hypothetical protein